MVSVIDTPSATWAQGRFAVVDVEGNGQQPPGLVELAVVPIVDGVIGEATSWLLHPADPIKYFATRIHGITNKDVANAPTVGSVHDEVMSALAGWAVVAHNAHVDVNVLTRELGDWQPPEVRVHLAPLLDRLAAGEADALVVTTTDRLARTTAVHRLDYYATREKWRLLILDSLDRLDNPEARLLHGIRVSVAEYERALIARRTRAALAYRRANGVRLGRPRSCPDDVLERVLQLRAGGARLVDVAAAMNDAGILTPAGSARWYPSHVSRLLKTQDARALADSAAG